MNHLKENPVGIDKAIQKQQTVLYTALSAIGNIDGYGRVYKNKKENKDVFEVYVGKNQYQNVVHSDKSKFFFEVEPSVNFEDAPQADVNIHFILDLNHFYKGEKEVRKDEEIKEQAVKHLIRTMFEPVRIYRDASKLSSSLNSFYGIEKIGFDDMHPKHIFTISGKLNFNYKRCK